MRRSKGLVILGPYCSGKTQMIEVVRRAVDCFKMDIQMEYVSPDMFTDHELYGPKLAYQDSATDDKNSRNLPI